MMCEEVVVEGGVGAAPDAAVAVAAFGVLGLVEGLGNEAPLDGDVFVVVEGDAFIDAPGGGAVIDDDVLAAAAAERVGVGLGEVAEAEAEIADDDVVGIDGEG